MKHILILVLLAVVSCKEAPKENVVLNHPKEEMGETQEIVNPELTIYNFNELEPLLHKTGDKIYVVNFWATWCGPCVKELPYFEELPTTYGDKDVEVLLVSLDFVNQYETKLKPFIREHEIQSEVIALNDPDANTWIPKVNADWSGSIPATIIYTKDKREFFEQSFTYEALEHAIKQFIN
ncbi:TlpA family protein disulfide reductase [Formosa sp. S-31]|uniref:TlpA family protein disulfide reductase n=1 Tax=Formosa sp. S-31 TaxID=2790949 RepID=UPI003EBCDF62